MTEKPRYDLSATVIVLNEEANIVRCLTSLNFIEEIIVIDTGSTDQTVALAKNLGAKVFIEDWKNFGFQKNSAMQKTSGRWVLNIDADEVITPELKAEIISTIQRSDAAAAYAIARKTFFRNIWIRFGGWYPNYVTRLVQKKYAKWTEPNVHESIVLAEGEVRYLQQPMLHYTFNSVADQVRTNIRYAQKGAHDLFKKQKKFKLRLLLLKPIGKFLETYILKQGFRDGFIGFIISVNAAHSMFMKYAFLKELENENTNH